MLSATFSQTTNSVSQSDTHQPSKVNLKKALLDSIGSQSTQNSQISIDKLDRSKNEGQNPKVVEGPAKHTASTQHSTNHQRQAPFGQLHGTGMYKSTLNMASVHPTRVYLVKKKPFNQVIQITLS